MIAETYICFMDISTTKTIHEGRNVKRFREMLGIKQEALAAALGDAWNQKKIPSDAIKNFTEEAAINIIGNTVTTVNDNATGQLFQIQPTINPVEKWMEVVEENKKLYAALLKEKDEKIELLQKLLEKK